MIALALALLHILTMLGLDAHLYEDGSLGILWAGHHIGACLVRAWGC